MQRARTKDEQFLIKLHNEMRDAETLDAYEIGRDLGYHDRGIKNIIRLLAQANLIKKYGDSEICITDRGTAVATELLEGV